MAMLIAWQTVNAVRHPGSQNYSRAFLVITPGITIKDRLRVLLPNDPNNYYRKRELVPTDMLDDIERAKIVITNYHAFRRRERMEVSKTGRALLQGRGPELNTLETEGQMLRRACGDLMGLKNIVVLNDEAHHCYREKPLTDDSEKLKGEDREEAKRTTRRRGCGSRASRPSSASSASPPSTICRRRPSSCAARAMPRARCSRGRSAISR
jgi:type III restriction enzyme